MKYQVNILDITHVMQQHIPLKNKYFSINFIFNDFSLNNNYIDYLIFKDSNFILQFHSKINNSWVEFTLKDINSGKTIVTFILTPSYENNNTLISTPYSTCDVKIIDFFIKLKDKFEMAMELLK